MKSSTIVIAAVSCWLVCCEVRGQEACTFSWVTADVAGTGPTNSNGVIEPGEDAMVSLHMSFRPDVGGTAVWDTNGGTGQIGTVAGFAMELFDVIGTSNLSTGTWMNSQFAPGFNLAVGHTIGPNNNLLNWQYGQTVIPGAIPDPRNDDWFFRARWRPADYSPRAVSFFMRQSEMPGRYWPGVILDVGLHDPMGNIEYRVDTWSSNEPEGGFVVVPAPGAMVLLFLVCMPRPKRGYAAGT